MYSEVFKEHCQLLKAISHPKRLEIINLLREGESSVTAIIEMLDLPQANLSQHLQIMRKADVVKTRRAGKEIYYQLSHPEILRACDEIRNLLLNKHQNDPLFQQLSAPITEFLPLTHDPVCKMRLSPKTSSYTYRYENQNYYFCAEGCLNKFRKEPQKYAE